MQVDLGLLWIGDWFSIRHQSYQSVRFQGVFLNSKGETHTLDNKVEGILIDYSNVTKSYRILDQKTNKVWISRSVKIIETGATKQHRIYEKKN